jgi:hypothetical protein
MDIKKLSYLYKLPETDIIKHKKYLSYNINEYCCNYQPEPYVHIEEGDYVTPIEFLKKYFRNVNKYDFFDKAFIEATNINKKKLIQYDNSVNNYEYIDYVILQYIINRPTTYIITVWPIANEFIDNIVLMLQKNGIVNVIRKISLTYNGAQNLLDQLYNKILITKTTYDRKIKFINTKLKYTNFVENNTNEFYVIVFDNINDLQLSGTGSIFKTLLRQEILKIIKQKYPNKNIEISDIMHINDYFYETIEYAQTYFHEQTLLFLEKKNLLNWYDNSMVSSFYKINAFKNWQIKNLNSIESQRNILLTGSSFFTIGIRKSSDIDSIFININQKNIRESELEKIIYNELFNEETKIPFIDSGMPDTSAWKKSWTEANNNFYIEYKETTDTTIDDFYICMNPKLYYYWNGLKIMNFNMTILLKLNRYIPSDYVDFIVLKLLYPTLTFIDLKISKDNIWINKKNRKIKKINELIIKSLKRYVHNDKIKINIKKYLI